MGVAISGWPLARAVSLQGQIGVVSSTGLDTVFARRLQAGDQGGHLRRALDHFPVPEIAERVWQKYFVAGGKKSGAAFKSKPIPSLKPTKALLELIVVANFVEVFLAKEGHEGLVGINLLEKIQLPTLPSLFGAMLAGVDLVLMGAGIPRAIPAALDGLSALQSVRMPIYVAGDESGEGAFVSFDPTPFAPSGVARLKRPAFFPIVTSHTLAASLLRKCTGSIEGFVVEGSTAGGHNAPPRGPLQLDTQGEPVYGPLDVPDLEKFRELGLPFWLAGSYGSAEGLETAKAAGAAGIQVGTPFALCRESGMDPGLRRRVLRSLLAGDVQVFTDPHASPTGFPFKVLGIEGTLSEGATYEARERICDLGYLRTAYRKPDGSVGFRCAAEPAEDFVAKGGNEADTAGRKCLCNGLLATAGLGQVRDGVAESPIVTIGDCARQVREFVSAGQEDYSASDVLDRLLGHKPTPAG